MPIEPSRPIVNGFRDIFIFSTKKVSKKDPGAKDVDQGQAKT